LADARNVYGTVLLNAGKFTPETQERIRDLAARTDSIKASLETTRDNFSSDLHRQLGNVADRSAAQRWLGLAVFGVTLALSSLIVNLSIRRSITGPIVRVIDGVERAVEEAAIASNRMAQSGQMVARDAHEQAACIQETSASLAAISDSTKDNAGRASEAD